MMPAMNVPWPNVSRYRRFELCDSKERSGPYVTLFGAASPWTGVTPESISATSIPAPVYPADHMFVARTACSTFRSEYGSPDCSYAPERRTAASGVTEATAASWDNVRRAVVGTLAEKPWMIGSLSPPFPPGLRVSPSADCPRPGPVRTITEANLGVAARAEAPDAAMRAAR